MVRTKNVEDALRFIDMAAKHHGWKPNRDQDFRRTLAEGLAANFNRYG